MRALITGARGFAGSFLARHLAECGDMVLGVERSASASASGFPSAGDDDGLATIDWDISEPAPEGTQAQIAEFSPEAIYHLAAISIPADCGVTEPTELARAVNVRGTQHVLGLAESLRPAPRVLLISSAHVYPPVDPASPVVHETSAVAPRNAYGKTKLAAEELAKAAAQRGLNLMIARAFNHTGPRQSDRLMLPEWCHKFARGDDPVEVTNRDTLFDITDVRDVVRAYRLLVERGQAGEIYNVGGGVPRRSGDLLARLAQLADPTRRIREQQPGRRQQPIADISRLTATTGWKPLIDLQTTIADTYAYWRAAVASRDA